MLSTKVSFLALGLLLTPAFMTAAEKTVKPSQPATQQNLSDASWTVLTDGVRGGSIHTNVLSELEAGTFGQGLTERAQKSRGHHAVDQYTTNNDSEGLHKFFALSVVDLKSPNNFKVRHPYNVETYKKALYFNKNEKQTLKDTAKAKIEKHLAALRQVLQESVNNHQSNKQTKTLIKKSASSLHKGKDAQDFNPADSDDDLYDEENVLSQILPQMPARDRAALVTLVTEEQPKHVIAQHGAPTTDADIIIVSNPQPAIDCPTIPTTVVVKPEPVLPLSQQPASAPGVIELPKPLIVITEPATIATSSPSVSTEIPATTPPQKVTAVASSAISTVSSDNKIKDVSAFPPPATVLAEVESASATVPKTFADAAKENTTTKKNGKKNV